MLSTLCPNFVLYNTTMLLGTQRLSLNCYTKFLNKPYGTYINRWQKGDTFIKTLQTVIGNKRDLLRRAFYVQLHIPFKWNVSSANVQHFYRGASFILYQHRFAVKSFIIHFIPYSKVPEKLNHSCSHEIHCLLQNLTVHYHVTTNQNWFIFWA
jgi:hypothetical protein